MKKYSKIVALGLSCAMAFSLAACGGDDKPQGTPDLDNVKSEQVTEAQWKSAFDFSQVTNVTLKNIERMTVAGVTTDEFSITKFDGDKVYEEAQWYDSEEVGGAPVKVVEKAYYSIGETESFEYSYDDDTKTWSKEATTWYPQISSFTSSLEAIANAYNSFTYDASKNGYVATEIPNFVSDEFDTFTVKIVGGKLSVAQMDMSVNEGGIISSASMIFQIYDYGTTSVTLPTVSGGEAVNGKVSESQWNNAFSQNAFQNVTIDMTSPALQGYDPQFKIDLPNDRVYQSMYAGKPDGSGNMKMEFIVACVDGDYHTFSRDEGEDWKYSSPASDLPVDIAANVTNMFGDFSYSAFTYNAAEKAYIAYKVVASNMGETFESVTIKFNGTRLKSIEMVYSAEQSPINLAMAVTVNFSAYGTTVIEIPNVEIPETPDEGDSENTMTRDQWLSALDEKSFNNCTISSVVEGFTMYVKMDVESGRYYMTMPNDNGGIGEMIAVRESEAAYHMYSRSSASDGKWIDGDIVEQDMHEAICGSIISRITLLASEYDNFKFDSKLGVYVHIDGNTVASFKGGKLYSLTLRVNDMEGTILFTDYGTTVIEIPDIVKNPEVVE